MTDPTPDTTQTPNPPERHEPNTRAFRAEIAELKMEDSDIDLHDVDPLTLTEYDAGTWELFQSGVMSGPEFKQRMHEAIAHVKTEEPRVEFYAYLGNRLMEDEAEQKAGASITPEALQAFRETVRGLMGEDEHAKRLEFSELDGLDVILYGFFTSETLSASRIKRAVKGAHATGHLSSAFFRGWLANKLGLQMLRKSRRKTR